MLDNIAKVKAGERCQMHPATNAWMRGDRYGDVVGVLPMGTKPFERVTVRLDVSGRSATFHAADVLPVES